MAEERGGRGRGAPRTPQPFSPFPFGSPLHQGLEQSSFSGSPGQKLLLASGTPGASRRVASEVVTPRLKGQDMYGGPVMFGSSSMRKHRLLSSSPYSAGLRSRQTDRAARASQSSTAVAPSSLPSSTSSSPSPLPTTDTMSTTARLILDTLDKMSTPIQDARRMPPLVQPRAEKRKLIEEQLNCSLKSPQRRRVRLGSGALSLAGPPLRKMYAPVGGFSNGLPSSAPPTPTPTPSPQYSPAAPPSPPPTQTKSSFKLKTKVTASSHAPAPAAAPPAPSLPTGALPITTLPVFDLSTPTPVTNGVKEVKTVEEVKVKQVKEMKGVEGQEEKREKNNNKKRAAEEEVPTGRKKVAAIAPEGSAKPLPVVRVPARVEGEGRGGEVVRNGEEERSKEVFSFTIPSVVATQASIDAASSTYTFSLPTAVSTTSSSSSSTVVVGRGVRTVSTQGDRRLVNRTDSPKLMFSSMPDVTNNLVRKVPSGDKGSSTGLPDLGGSGGLGAAPSLRIGSVMDILGKKS